MPFSSMKELPFNHPPVNGLASKSIQQLQLVCTWSANAPPRQSGPSPLPFPLDSHSVTAIATATSELFLFGGYEQESACGSSHLYVFSTRDFSTTLLQTSGEVPTPRFAHSVALTGTTLLICGGTTNIGDRNALNHDSIYLLNIVSARKWTRVVVNGPGPGCRYYHTTNVVSSQLFVFGGRIGGNVTNDMWMLNLNCLKSRPQWESYEPTPGNEKPLPRSSHVSVTTEDRIIIFGGYSGQHQYNDTWSFNISTRKWTELQCTGSIPSPRSGHAAVLVDNVMYVFGGVSLDGGYLGDLYALQLSMQRWFKLQNVGPSPYRRSHHAMACNGARVFVLGGYSPGAGLDEISLIHSFDTKDITYPEPGLDQVASSSDGAASNTVLPTLKDDRSTPCSEARQEWTSEKRRLFALACRSSAGEPQRSTLSSLQEKGFSHAEGNAAEAAKRAGLELREHADPLVQTSPVERREAELVDMQTKIDELVVFRDQQVGRYEKELANMRAKLEAKESELEAVRLRLTDAEMDLTKSKAEADELRAQNATGSANASGDEHQVTRRLIERVRVIEAEMASKRWNEKSIEEMECRNEG